MSSNAAATLNQPYYSINIIDDVRYIIDDEDNAASFYTSREQEYLDYINHILPALDEAFVVFQKDNSGAIDNYQETMSFAQGYFVEDQSGNLKLSMSALLEDYTLPETFSPEEQHIYTKDGKMIKNKNVCQIVFGLPEEFKTEFGELEFIFQKELTRSSLKKFAQRMQEILS